VQPFSFGTHEFERTYDRPPRAPRFQSLHFTLSRFVSPSDLNVPPLPEGLFDKEAWATPGL
jgi:hypothetical protein